MAEQSSFAIGDEVLIVTSEAESHPGVLIGSNANTTNEKLLYTVKLENHIWVGPEGRVFPKDMAVETAMALLEEHEEKLSQGLLADQLQREEEERRLAEAEVETEEEAESAEA
jgi:hypothetical protein